MKQRMLWLAMASLGFCTLPASATNLSLPTEQIGDAVTKAMMRTTKPTAKEAAARLEGKMSEIKALREKASGITQAIGKMATENKLPTENEALTVIQDLIQQLKQTNEALAKLQEDVEGILGWIEGQNENLAVMATDIQQIKRVTWGNYMQFQWQDTEQQGSTARNDGFQMRRFRVSTTNRIDDKTSAKFSFDVSAGSQRLAADLKDAQIIYDFEPSVEEVGASLIFGQQPLPLGFELERSSAEREFPERAIYNQRIFGGERDRGISFKYGLGKGVFVHAGVWNGLTVGDPQLTGANTFRDLDGNVAFTGGIRYYGTQFDVGISTLQGRRPGFTPTAPPNVPSVNRSLFYIDGTYVGLLDEGLVLRGELMFGRDRDPLGGITTPTFRQQTQMWGYQVQATYNINSGNQLHVRWQYYDPDMNDVTTTNNNLGMWGYAYTHWLNPHFKITLSYEMPTEQGTLLSNNVWTIRSQFRL